MSWTADNGFVGRTYDELVKTLTDSINKNFNQNYTPASIQGTNFFKSFYGGIQLVMSTENGISSIASKLVDYLRTSDEEISTPKSSPDGIIQLFKDDLNLAASFKPITTKEEVGLINIAVNVKNDREDYAAIKAKILHLIGKYCDGSSFYEGSERGIYTALNGQNFEVAYHLPNEIPLYIKINITKSDNSTADTKDPDEIRKIFLANFEKNYRFGFDFEPARYLQICDIPYAATIDLSYSTDDVQYKRDVLQANFNDLITIKKVVVEEVG